MPRTLKPKVAKPKDTTAHPLAVKFPAWKLSKDGTTATRTLVFPRHVDAVVFIARIAIRAEVLGVHPTITLTRARAEVSVGGAALSKAEQQLIAAVDSLCPYGDKRVPKQRRAGILRASKQQ